MLNLIITFIMETMLIIVLNSKEVNTLITIVTELLYLIYFVYNVYTILKIYIA